MNFGSGHFHEYTVHIFFGVSSGGNAVFVFGEISSDFEFHEYSEALLVTFVFKFKEERLSVSLGHADGIVHKGIVFSKNGGE